jgi:uncharacterized paraquat-inducible protein A
MDTNTSHGVVNSPTVAKSSPGHGCRAWQGRVRYDSCMKHVAGCPCCKAHLSPKLSSNARRCPRCKTLVRESERSKRFAQRLAAALLITVLPTAAIVGRRMTESPSGGLAGFLVGFTLLLVVAFCLDPYTTEYEKVEDARACPGCGYDLTGNVSGTCPECGRSTNSPSPNQLNRSLALPDHLSEKRNGFPPRT